MRIKKLQLAGLAVAMIGVSAGGASAEDVTITTATTQPIETNNPLPNPPAGAGDVTIGNGGSIAVTAGQAAVTVNSNNDVTNDGSLTSNNANGSTGILLTGGFSGTITSDGSIQLLEDYTRVDDNNDGDLDDPWASGNTRNGILLESGTFTGDITTSGTIVIEGNDSAGVRLDGTVVGELDIGGAFAIVGDDSYAFVLGGGAAGGVTGDVLITGSGAIQGENAGAINIGAPITGALEVFGAWTATGYNATARPADDDDLDADDTLQGGSVLAVQYSVTDGVLIRGIGLEDDIDDDGDTVDDEGDDADSDDNRTADLHVYGEAPAIHIAADPSANLILGATASGFGLHNRGRVIADGIYDAVNATALRLEGLGLSTATLVGGVLNDGTLLARGVDADSYAIYVGAGAILPTIRNRNVLQSFVGAEDAQTAYGVYIGTGANVSTLENSGVMVAQLFGEVGGATTIQDDSGTLDHIVNAGSIRAIVFPTDEDPTDDVIPVANGPTIAIDVADNTTGVLIEQIADAAFHDDDDDDTVDDDAARRPAIEIIGDILLGIGDDDIVLTAGKIEGDISFNDGADEFEIDDGASFVGRITDSDSDLAITVNDGVLELRGGATNISTANFNMDSELRVLLSENLLESTLITATGAVTFAPGSAINLIVPEGLPVADTIVFLTAAGGIAGSGNVTGPAEGVGTSFLYDIDINHVGNSLEADYTIKTAAQLGLNNNQTAAFNPILDALRENATASAAFAALDNEFDFFNAYLDMVPTFASAGTELATTAIQQMQSATTNRLSATRLHDLDEVSVWAQEIAYGLNREPPTNQGQEFRGHGFGMAIGIDGPLNNGGLFGLSASFITSEFEEPERPEGEVATTFGQANAYLGTAMGPIDLDFIGGVGVGRMSSERYVEIGDAFAEIAEADWWAYEAHGAIRASAPMRISDWMIVSPQAQLTYVYLGEEGYTEEGGGAAVDYEASDATSQRLWGDVGLEFSGRLRMRGQAIIAPRLYAGWRANLLDEEAERTFRFVSGTEEFTLVDEGFGDGGPVFGIGVDATNGYSTFTLGYEGEFGDQIDRHSLNASIRFRF